MDHFRKMGRFHVENSRTFVVLSVFFIGFSWFGLGIASRSRGKQARERPEEQRKAKRVGLVWILSAKWLLQV